MIRFTLTKKRIAGAIIYAMLGIKLETFVQALKSRKRQLQALQSYKI